MPLDSQVRLLHLAPPVRPTHVPEEGVVGDRGQSTGEGGDQGRDLSYSEQVTAGRQKVDVGHRRVRARSHARPTGTPGAAVRLPKSAPEGVVSPFRQPRREHDTSVALTLSP